MIVPAVGYDYSYSRMNRSNQGLAQKARSTYAVNQMSARRKVSSDYTTQRSVNSHRTSSNKILQTRSLTSKNKNVKSHADIDIPIVVKKKVELQKPEEMKLVKPKTKAQSKPKTEIAKKSIVATIFAFGMLFLICMRYAQINELSHKINSLEKDLTSVESLNQQLGAEVDSKTDLNYIEKYAKYQLGMQKPDEKQIVRIAYEKQDRISTPIVISEEREPNFFEKLFQDLKNLID